MKNRLVSTLLILVAGLTVISCDPAEQYKSELAEIDSSLNRLETLETLYDGIEFDSLQLMVDHVVDNEAKIKALYQPDTLNAEFGRNMTDSKAIRKTLKDVNKVQVKYSDELNAIKNQFIDLKDDILNGLYDDAQIKEYLATEKAALKRADMAFMDFHKTQLEEKHRYYVVVPKVDQFILALEAQLENE